MQAALDYVKHQYTHKSQTKILVCRLFFKSRKDLVGHGEGLGSKQLIWSGKGQSILTRDNAQKEKKALVLFEFNETRQAGWH